MSKVLTFSRTFPAYHPKAGQPTYFVERLWQSFALLPEKVSVPSIKITLSMNELANGIPKHHTIRSGNRWKVGDKFSPRVWSGRPYASKQLVIAQDIEIKKTWDIEWDINGVASMCKPGGQMKYLDEGVDELIAKNDGLSEIDFAEWLVMPNYRKEVESGPMQIICWNDQIEY